MVDKLIYQADQASPEIGEYEMAGDGSETDERGTGKRSIGRLCR